MLRSLFVLAILALGIAAGIRDRFAALLLYAWFALFRPQEWLWVDISRFRLSLLLGLFLVVPSFLSGVLPNVTHPLCAGGIAFLGAALLAQGQAVAPEIGWFWIDYLARLLLVCLLAVRILSTQERVLGFLGVVAASFIVHASVAGLDSIRSGGARITAGYAGSFVDNNGYAVAIAMVLFLAIGVGQNVRNRWARWALFGTVPLSGYALVSTFSRGGFLALGAGTATFLALQERRVASAGAAAALCLAAYLALPLPAGYLDRIESIRNYEEIGERSAISRPHFWRVAIDMVRDRPLGIGLRNFESAYDAYDFSHGEFGRKRDVHSIYFQTLAETGIAGGAIFAGLIACSFVVLFRVRARARDPARSPEERQLLFTLANALIASMTSFAIGGAFISLALNDVTWFSFAAIAGLDLASRRTAPLGPGPHPTPAAPRPARASEQGVSP